MREVMERGSELYEKFAGFVTDMEAIGGSIRKTDQSYTNAMKKLVDGRGNLIRQVELLKKLGLRTNKSIPNNLLDRADVDQAELALAAEADPADDANLFVSIMHLPPVSPFLSCMMNEVRGAMR